jgi:hypothetical protein
MRDVAGDPAALELLREQRSRLADRMRAPWWYLAGGAVVWAVAFAGPISSRYLPRSVPTWPVLVAALALAGLLQWRMTRVTGISLGIPDLTYRPGRPVRITMLVVSVAAIMTEHVLIDHGLLAAAIVVAVLAMAAGVASIQAALRGIRKDLRAGGGATA